MWKAFLMDVLMMSSQLRRIASTCKLDLARMKIKVTSKFLQQSKYILQYRYDDLINVQECLLKRKYLTFWHWEKLYNSFLFTYLYIFTVSL